MIAIKIMIITIAFISILNSGSTYPSRGISPSFIFPIKNGFILVLASVVCPASKNYLVASFPPLFYKTTGPP